MSRGVRDALDAMFSCRMKKHDVKNLRKSVGYPCPGEDCNGETIKPTLPSLMVQQLRKEVASSLYFYFTPLVVLAPTLLLPFDAK